MDISYKCSHTICGFCVWLFFFIEHNVFKFHSCCSLNQCILLWIIPLYGWVIFHSTDVAQFVYVKGTFLGTHSLPLVSMLPMIISMLQQQSCVPAMETIFCAKLKMLTICILHLQLYWDISDIWHCVSLRHATWWFWCRYILQNDYHNKVS